MEINNGTIIICLFIISILFSGLIGFILGRLGIDKGVSYIRPKSLFDQNEKTSIEIDDKKFVTDISIKGLEKKFQTLGETKKSNENISESVDRLKNLKR
jgi:hypothetical protein